MLFPQNLFLCLDSALRRPVRASGVSGYQNKSMPCRLTSHLCRKCTVLRLQIPTAYQCHSRFLQQCNITPGPQNSGTFHPQSHSKPHRITFTDSRNWYTTVFCPLLQVVIKAVFFLQQVHNMSGHLYAIAQRSQIRRHDSAILSRRCHQPDSLSQLPQLWNCQRLPVRIPQMAAQQQESPLPAVQRNRFLMGAGAFTSSSVKTPSLPRSMGKIL